MKGNGVRVEYWRQRWDTRERAGLRPARSNDRVHTLAGKNPLALAEIMVRDFLNDFPDVTEAFVRRGTKLPETHVRQILVNMCYHTRATRHKGRRGVVTYSVRGY